MNEADDQFISRALQAKKHAALRRLAQAQAIMSEAQREEQAAHRELAELDVAERVLRNLPNTDEQLAAVNSPMTLRTVLRRGLVADPADAVIANGPDEAAFARSQKNLILRECYMMLKDGSWKSTEELYAGLVQRGLALRVANPPQRVSQILSADQHFRNQRGRGWSLDPEVGRQALSASDMERQKRVELEDEPMRLQARRLVNDERHAARYVQRDKPETD